MSSYIISHVSIDTSDNILSKPIRTEIKKILDSVDFLDYWESSDFNLISFRLEGSNFIDYDVLDLIKELLLKNKIKCNIIANEFIEECAGGYYYSSEDENA